MMRRLGTASTPGRAVPAAEHSPIRLLLADDHEEICQTVAAILGQAFKIIGRARNGEELLHLAALHAPDLVVLDIDMPVLNGIETATRIRAFDSRVRLVFLTMDDDRDFLNAALSIGALGFVLKTHIVTDLVPALLTVLEGKVFVSPSMYCPT